MKMCQSHWDKLRKEIDDKGLSHLVVSRSDMTPESLMASLKEESDPLLLAGVMIYSSALEAGGTYLMTADYCPLCELTKHVRPPEGKTTEADENWINGCIEEIVSIFRTKKLIPPLQ